MVLHREGRREDSLVPKKIMMERFSVANRIIFIIDKINDLKELSFFSLFDETFSKLEKINTLLAVLELLKRQFMTAEQTEKFSDITLKLREGETVDMETVVEDIYDEYDGNN